MYEVIAEMVSELSEQEERGLRLISGVRDIRTSSEKLISSIKILTLDISEIAGSVNL